MTFNFVSESVLYFIIHHSGFVLTLMGVDHSELKSIIRKNVRLFLADISPIVSSYNDFI